MKYLTHALPFVIVLLFTGCDKKNEPSLPDIHTSLLSRTWNLVSVTLDEEESLLISPDFQLIMTKGEFEVTGTLDGSPWPSSGAWVLVNSQGNGGALKRMNDDVTISYNFSADGKLTLAFTYTGEGFGAARQASVQGDWLFVLERSE